MFKTSRLKKSWFAKSPLYYFHTTIHTLRSTFQHLWATTLWLTSFGTLSCLLLKICEPLTTNKNKLQKLFIQCRDRHHIVKVACALERSVEHALPITLSHIPVTQVEQLGGQTGNRPKPGRSTGPGSYLFVLWRSWRRPKPEGPLMYKNLLKTHYRTALGRVFLRTNVWLVIWWLNSVTNTPQRLRVQNVG